MPSATAKNGGDSTSVSSLALRWRPTSVRPACSAIRRAIALLPVAVLGVADADHVRHLEPLGGLQLAAVQIRAVGGPHVLHVHELPAQEDPRVRGRRERVVDAGCRRCRRGPWWPRRACRTSCPARSPCAATTSSCGSTPPRRSARRLRRALGAAGGSAGRRAPRSRSAREVAHARCAPPTGGRGRARRGSRTSARPRAARPRRLLELEGQVGHADRDAVAGPQRRALHPPAVDLHAVRGAEVRHHPAVALAAELHVAAGDVRVVHHHVAVAAAAHHHAAAAEHAAAAVAHQQGAARRSSLGSSRRDSPVGRVDHRVAEVARRRRGVAPAAPPPPRAATSSCAWMPNSPRSSRSSVWNSTCGRLVRASRSWRACSSR